MSTTTERPPASEGRRRFLRTAAAGAAAAPFALTTLAACAADATVQSPTQSADHSGGTTAPHAATPDAHAVSEEMDRLHEAGIKSFPAATKGKGGVRLKPRMEKGVKCFDLRCSRIKWEVEPGKLVDAWAYNEQVPGPEIRVREGDRVRVTVQNDLAQSTSVHFHGLIVPIEMDGVPFITQPPIKPGATFVYEFTVRNAGSHMYHSHHNSAQQVGMGLLGAFIVEPRDASREPRVDVDYTMILNDGYHGYTINGKGFPATEPIVAKRGQKVRIRFMNEGMMIHPMHLHGMPMQVIAKDGWDQPTPWMCDTLNVAPGERWDVLVDATEPGTWAFHCHILPHAESAHGMFGMVTALIVK